ncbi:LytTR family DNA-binding domain-containing protein [Paenibacillus sp. FSL K6-1230]|uniref:LytTR family DNA-binding domain-containing protein n=1 Tax=Paenibacillus sp. FSL K6-1230 TaxID=2921603 RepID=UPI0030F632EB
MLTVTTEPDGAGGIKHVNISDVWYMKYSSRLDRIVVHTQRDEYFMTGTITYWEQALNDSRFKYLKLDRSTLVNTDNIVVVNSIYKRVFFEYDPGRRSKSCDIVNHRYKQLQRMIEVLNPDITLI